MTTKNDITGDSIRSRSSSQLYRDNWDRIFGKKDSLFKDVVHGTESHVSTDDSDEATDGSQDH